MAISKRDRRALIALVGLCAVAFFSREILKDGYRGFTERSADSRRPAIRSSRGRTPEPMPVPNLPMVELNEDDVLLKLERVARTSNERPTEAQFTEIFYNPPGTTEDTEFVELANSTGRTIALSGWRIDQGIDFEFPDGATLADGGHLILCGNVDAVQSAFGDSFTIGGVFNGKLNNSGEGLRLINERGEVVLEQEFGDSLPWPPEADGEGASLQLPPGAAASEPANWLALQPTPGLAAPVEASGASVRILKAEHQPQHPGSNESVTVSAEITSSNHPFSVGLHLEVSGWEYVYSTPSNEVIASGDPSEIGPQRWRFTAVVPPMPDFTLARYWFTAKNASGLELRFPSPGLSPPHSTYFVSDRNSISSLPVYTLRMDPADMRSMQSNPFRDATYPATLIAEGEIYDRVQIRNRGAFARSWPKKSYKIIFDKDHRFRGMSRVNLNSGWRDPALVREVLAYHIYEEAGAFSLRSRPVRVNVNGQFWGLFVEVEQPDKNVLKSRGLKGAALYKADSPSNESDERSFETIGTFLQHYEKETAEEQPYDDLAELCHELAGMTNVREFFETHVDLPRYINFLCATAFCQNWDSYNKNHFIGLDREGSGKWFMLPWDLDRTLGDHWRGSFDEFRLPSLLGTKNRPGVTGWNRLTDRFFSDGYLRRLYAERMKELLDGAFAEARLFSVIDALKDQIAVEADLDRKKWGGTSNWRHALDEVKTYVRNRRIFLIAEVERF